MAAWNGVPAGETYLKLTVDPDHPRPNGASATAFLRVPVEAREKEWVDRRVRVDGYWTVPTPIRASVGGGDEGPLEEQVPIQAPIAMPTGSEDSGSMEIVEREPIFIAHSIELI